MFDEVFVTFHLKFRPQQLLIKLYGYWKKVRML